MQSRANSFYPRTEMNEASKALIVVHGQAVLAALKDFETKLFIQQFEAINQQRGQCN